MPLADDAFHLQQQPQPKRRMKPNFNHITRTKLGAGFVLLFAAGPLIVDAAYNQCVIQIGVKIKDYCGDNNHPQCVMIKYFDLNNDPSYIETCEQGQQWQQCNLAPSMPGKMGYFTTACVSAGCYAANYPSQANSMSNLNLSRRSGNPCFE